MININKKKVRPFSFSFYRYKFSNKFISIISIVCISSVLFFFLQRKTIQSYIAQPLDSQLKIESILIKHVTSDQEDSGLPVYLKIPQIKVDTTIEYLGIANNGFMDITKSPFKVAWYKLGQRPGENGSAVIAGHYGTWKNGDKSVFDNLNKLSKGDKIYIEDDKNKTITFDVRESRNYDPKADATDVFNSKDGKSHLNLITCEGVWNNTTKSYSQRLVVFADKELL